MAASFSRTAYNRLPAAVKGLSREARTACIFLRLRKTEEQIAKEMEIPIEKAKHLANEVRRALISSGEYDMIADPVMVPIGDGIDEPVSPEAGMEEKVLLGEFISALGEATACLCAYKKRLLHLFFERGMTGAEILDFLKNSGLTETGEDTKAPKNESDVYYILGKILKELVAKMADKTPIGRGTLTIKGLKDIFLLTGVPTGVPK